MAAILTNAIFNKTLNSHCRTYYVQNPSVPSPPPQEEQLSLLSLVATCSDLLLRHDAVVFQVYGENIPLVFLLNAFGLSGVESLIEQKAIHFALWTPLVTYHVSELTGIDPLQSGVLNSPPHSDPEESIKIGLTWYKERLNSFEQASLIRKVKNTYILPPKEIADKSARFGIEGYTKNKFKNLGLPNQKDVRSLALEERKQLCNLATESMDLAFMSQFGLDSYDAFRLFELMREEITVLHAAQRIQAAEARIFDIEGIPSIGSLVVERKIDISKIPKIRSSPDSEKYRKWLFETADKKEATQIGKEYIDAIIEPGFFDRFHGKIIKSLCISGFSAGVGALIAGPVGAAVGLTAGSKVTETLVDPAIDLLDAVFLDGLLRGWSPRNYFEKEIRPTIRSAST